MRKYYNIFKKYFHEYIDVISMYFAVILLELIVRRYIGLGFGKLSILFILKDTLFIGSLLFLLKNKQRKCVEIIVIILLIIYSYAQTLHYMFFYTLFSFKKATVLNELVSVFSEIFVKIDYEHFIFVLPFVIVLVGCFVNKETTNNNYKRVSLSFFALSMCIIFTLSTNFYLNKNQGINDWTSDKYLLETFQNKIRFYDRFGILEYIAKDISNIYASKKNNTSLSTEERKSIDNFIQNHINNNINDMTGMYKGKNLILILAESLHSSAISEELTPTLYHISNNSYYFANHYAPIYQSSTGDSEFISLTSMIPSVDYGTTSYTFYNNDYPFALPQLFNKEGYNSNSYHSFTSNFYNRELFHDSLGFDAFYGLEHLGIESDWYYEESFNWHNDDKLFEATIRNTKYQEKPFFDFVITASGHMPYDIRREELFVNIDKINNSSYANFSEEAKCYLASQINFDKGLKQLIDDLKRINQFNNTIIVIYGDHYPYGLSDEKAVKEIVQVEGYQRYRVPFMIYDPLNEKSIVIEDITSTFDIYPTICNLFGISTSDAYIVGNDVFSQKKRFVPFMDRSILTDDFYYNSINNEIEIISNQYNENDKNCIIQDVNQIFDIGQVILNKNYYSLK